MKKLVSIIVPVYNEEKNIRPMVEQLMDAMRQCEDRYDYEIIFRDNASKDKTLEELRRVAAENKRVKVIENARNYGHDILKDTFSGRVSGDVVISIAGDLQEPPELIPEFLKWYEAGYEVVCGQKVGSEEGKVKYSLRKLFYSIIDRFSDIPQYRNISGITLTSRRIRELMWQSRCDIPIRFFLADLGCEIKLIPYQQRKRQYGKSSYNVWRYLTFSIESLIATSNKPLRVATVLGVCMSALSFLVGLVYLIIKLIFWHRFSAGTAPILIGMFFLGSVQLFFIGLLGEYVGNVLNKVRPKTPPIVKELINFDGEDPYLIRSVEQKKTEEALQEQL